MDHIKNALTKTKNPLKKWQKCPQIIQRPQTLLEDPKNVNKGLIVYLGPFCNVWGLFCIRLGGFLYLVSAFFIFIH